jgi:endonuclease YncB( thermonuclease family)
MSLKTIKYLILVPLLLFLISAPSPAMETAIVGKVMKVTDGDTVVISPTEGSQFFICRLYGIDAPETPKYSKRGLLKKPGQPYGEEASQELKRLILGQTVDITLTGAKTYRREVCRISKDSQDINLEMVKKGYAWAYRHYLHRPYASEYIEAEKEARDRHLGLWADANPTPPWEFRKSLKNRYAR